MKKIVRRSYKFTEKRHSKKAMVSAGIGAVSQILYFVFVFLSFKEAGNLSTYFGGVGVIAMIFSLVAFIVGHVALKEEDIFPLYPKLAIALSGISALCWVGTYILGFIRG